MLTESLPLPPRYKVEVSGKSLPVLTNLDKGKYGVVVFENLNKYLNMDKWNRELLDKYCREYSVGVVGFQPASEETLVGAQLRGFPLFIHTNLQLKVGGGDCSSFLRPGFVVVHYNVICVTIVILLMECSFFNASLKNWF